MLQSGKINSVMQDVGGLPGRPSCWNNPSIALIDGAAEKLSDKNRQF